MVTLLQDIIFLPGDYGIAFTHFFMLWSDIPTEGRKGRGEVRGGEGRGTKEGEGREGKERKGKGKYDFITASQRNDYPIGLEWVIFIKPP